MVAVFGTSSCNRPSRFAFNPARIEIHLAKARQAKRKAPHARAGLKLKGINRTAKVFSVCGQSKAG